jgi:DNA modification methylase
VGDTILDPFCGSGTGLVEALVAGRSALGTDVDPVAAFVARAKTRRYRGAYLRRSAARVVKNASRFERSAEEYKRLQFDDLSPAEMRQERGRLWLPSIPDIAHWFRRYVQIDLARIIESIRRAKIPSSHRDLLRLCFAAIIRSASNADPVPVSGLEVTAHMKRRNAAGRIVNPFLLFRQAVERTVDAVEDLQADIAPKATARAFTADATALSRLAKGSIDVVITSPPYHNAVDYYRRHTLEMYWLGFTDTPSERLALRGKYIGSASVRRSHPFVGDEMALGILARRWEARIRRTSEKRANSFRHYVVAMQRVFKQLHRVLKRNGRAVFVVGKSSWNGARLPTDALFHELASGLFELEARWWYPVKNRYMSYTRHNNADISHEHVLVFKRLSLGGRAEGKGPLR